MLVLNLTREPGAGTIHAVQRFVERTHLEPASLLRTVAEINLYLPDDWRLTRRRNDFRIQVVDPAGCYALVGESFRYGDDDGVLHIVDTVLSPQMADEPRIRGEKLKQQPELLVPNLYFFRPTPDDAPGPLFARQYEKMRIGKNKQPVGDQYHRVHPLTKGGLDTDHYRWLRWDTTGHVEFVNFPDPAYHGKDYWVVPKLNATGKRADAADYIEALDTLLSDYRISSPELPEARPTPYEVEHKLLCPQPLQGTDVLAAVRESIGHLGWQIEHESKVSEHVDTYLDDDAFALYGRGISLRLRKAAGVARVTFKSRVTGCESPDAEQAYRRIEEEAPITRQQMKSALAGRWIGALPYRLATYFAPEVGELLPRATVRVNRVWLAVVNGAGQRAEVCFDTGTFTVGAKTVGSDTEVEIESKGMPRNDVNTVADLLAEGLQLQPSPESKYERALRLAGITRD